MPLKHVISVLVLFAITLLAGPVSAQWWTHGAATPHCNGETQISAIGSGKIGTRFTLVVKNAMPVKTPNLMFVGPRAANLKLPCLAGPAPAFYVNLEPVPGLEMPVTVDDAGTGYLDLVIPHLPILVGLEFNFQFVQVEVLGNCAECRTGFINLTGTKGLGVKILAP